MSPEERFLRTDESTTQSLAGLADDSVVVFHEQKYRVDWYESDMDEFSKRTLIHSRLRTRGLGGASRMGGEYDISTGFRPHFLRGSNLYYSVDGRGKLQRLDLKAGKTVATSLNADGWWKISGDDGLAIQCTDQREFTLLRQGKTFKLPNLDTPERGTYCPDYGIFTRDGQWYLFDRGDLGEKGGLQGLVVRSDGSHEPFTLPEGLRGSCYVRGIGDVPFTEGFQVPVFFDPTGRISEAFRKVAAQGGDHSVGPGTEVDPAQGFWKAHPSVRDLGTGDILYSGSW